MTYSSGSSILANDYNAFATSTNSINQIYCDLYPGATTLPNAGYGYGQTPIAVPVAVGENVTANQWTLLFNRLKKVGAHQGTPVVPPLPGTPPGYYTTGTPAGTVDVPTASSTVTAYTGLGTLLSTLDANRFKISPSQLTYTAGVNRPSSSPWAHTQTFSYTADFGTWDNARYFFNSGGRLLLNGSYAPTGSADAVWATLLSNMSPLSFNYNSTTPGSGTNSGTGAGFYGLTTTPQAIYTKTAATGGHYYYSAIYVTVNAWLGAAAGTAGSNVVHFSVELVDAEALVILKHGITTYRLDKSTATGANVAYPGSVIISNTGYSWS